MSERYPSYHYVHQVEPNPLQAELLTVIAGQQERLLELREGRFTRSQDVEKALQPALHQAGFMHSVTNRQVEGLFSLDSDFELDFWHPSRRIALEVEKGKHFNIWRDVCKFAESTLIDHAVLIIPCEKANQKGQCERIYLSTVDSLANVVRLYLGLKSMLVIGY